MVKVNSFLLQRDIGHKCLIKLCSFSGVKVKFIQDNAKTKICDFKPEYIILYEGTNDLNSEMTSIQITKSIIDLYRSLKTDSNMCN